MSKTSRAHARPDPGTTSIATTSAKPGKAQTTARARSVDALAEKLVRLGVLREEDLVLHLPLRYEDHTQLMPLADVQSGATVQTEGVVVSAEIQYRPRRQLVCLLRDRRERRDASARAALLLVLSEPAEGARAGQARARVRRCARWPLRSGDRASAIQGRRRPIRRCPTA